MMFSELMCLMANDRMSDMRHEADMARLAAHLRPAPHGLRTNIARTLHAVAECLEPNLMTQDHSSQYTSCDARRAYRSSRRRPPSSGRCAGDSAHQRSPANGSFV